MATYRSLFPGKHYPPHFSGQVPFFFIDFNPDMGGLLDFPLSKTINRSSDSFAALLSNGLRFELSGSGFKYDDGAFTAGTIRRISVSSPDGKSTIATLEDIKVDAENFFARAESSGSYDLSDWLMKNDDTMIGSSGNDDMFGAAGDDRIKGGAGEDTMGGGSGRDSLDGGKGFDTLYFGGFADPTSKHGVTLDAARHTVVDPWGNKESFSGFEAFDGAQFGDVLIGSDADEAFRGMGGRDRIDGKGGIDEIRYDHEQRSGEPFAGAYVNLAKGRATDVYGQKDKLSHIENVRGSYGFDTIVGSDGKNVLDGLNGNDALHGGKGGDILKGGDDDDVLDGGAGADRMEGGAGGDTYYVNNRHDVVVEVVSNVDQEDDTIVSSLTYSLKNPLIEDLKLVGSAAIDATGNALHNFVSGNNGDNVVNGKGGFDELRGGHGADTFVFDTKLDDVEGAGYNVDYVADFRASDDSFRLDSRIFKSLTMAGPDGQLDGDCFKATEHSAFGGFKNADPSDRIIYSWDSNDLYYDRDGSGAKYEAVKFAHLENDVIPKAANFFVV